MIFFDSEGVKRSSAARPLVFPRLMVWQIPMEPCEIGAGGDTTGNSTVCVDVASSVDWENGIGVSGRPDNLGSP